MAPVLTLESREDVPLQSLVPVVHRAPVAKFVYRAKHGKLEIQSAKNLKSSLGTLILEVQHTICLIR